MTTKQIALNVGFSKPDELANISERIRMKILQVVMYHVGIENKISRKDLLAELRAAGFNQDDRTIRLAISEMRRIYGIPIAGTGGIHGGYWILKNREEKDAYCLVELHDRGTSLLEQESSINKAAADWYPNGQLRLPG